MLPKFTKLLILCHDCSFFQQKNPRNLSVLGYLTFGHNTPFGVQYIFILSTVDDYSMIDATAPEPTVRPPSRL